MNRLHQELAPDEKKDVFGGSLPVDADAEDGSAHEKMGLETPEGQEPTEQEKKTLRHIGESLPISAWLVAIVELSERFTYYGVQGLFQNYVQLPYDGSLGRGALGMAHT